MRTDLRLNAAPFHLPGMLRRSSRLEVQDRLRARVKGEVAVEVQGRGHHLVVHLSD